jgi:hypothetical protein
MSAQDIIGFCQAEVGQHINDCAGFVRGVARQCGVFVFGNANEIVDNYILKQAAGWKILGSESDAVDAATTGKLVIGGLKASGHGHVVVIVGMKNTVHPGRAYGFWGRYHGLRADALGSEINVGKLHLGHGPLTWLGAPAPFRTSVILQLRPAHCDYRMRLKERRIIFDVPTGEEGSFILQTTCR